MKCIYCGKEIVNGNMCEECSSKRKELGFNVSNINSPNPNANIQSSNVTQKLYCKDCGSPLNTDGSCTNFTCQKQREKEANGNTHFVLSLISAIFSSLYNVCLAFCIIDTNIMQIQSTQGGGTITLAAFLFIPLIYLFIPQIISYIFSIKAIVAYRKYKDNTSISKTRKILNYINVANSFIFSIGLILLIAFIIMS